MMSSMVLIILTSAASTSMGTLSSYSTLGILSADMVSAISLSFLDSALLNWTLSTSIFVQNDSQRGVSSCSDTLIMPCS